MACDTCKNYNEENYCTILKERVKDSLIEELNNLMDLMADETFYAEKEPTNLEEEYYNNGIDWCFEQIQKVINKRIEEL